MPDDFGHLNLVTPTFLERIVRGELLGQEHPRKPRDQAAKSAKNTGADNTPENESDTKASISSQHIDLRI